MLVSRTSVSPFSQTHSLSSAVSTQFCRNFNSCTLDLLPISSNFFFLFFCNYRSHCCLPSFRENFSLLSFLSFLNERLIRTKNFSTSSSSFEIKFDEIRSVNGRFQPLRRVGRKEKERQWRARAANVERCGQIKGDLFHFARARH